MYFVLKHITGKWQDLETDIALSNYEKACVNSNLTRLQGYTRTQGLLFKLMKALIIHIDTGEGKMYWRDSHRNYVGRHGLTVFIVFGACLNIVYESK